MVDDADANLFARRRVKKETYHNEIIQPSM